MTGVPAMEVRISPHVQTATHAAYCQVAEASEVSPKPGPIAQVPHASTVA